MMSGYGVVIVVVFADRKGGVPWYVAAPMLWIIGYLLYHMLPFARDGVYWRGIQRRGRAYTEAREVELEPRRPRLRPAWSDHAELFGEIRSAIEEGEAERIERPCRVSWRDWPDRFAEEVVPYIEARAPQSMRGALGRVPLRRVREPEDVPEWGGVEVVLEAEVQGGSWEDASDALLGRVSVLTFRHDARLMLGADSVVVLEAFLEASWGERCGVDEVVLEGVGVARADVLGALARVCGACTPGRLTVRGGSWSASLEGVAPPNEGLEALTLERLASSQRRVLCSWVAAQVRELRLVEPRPGWVDAVAHEGYPGLERIEVLGARISTEELDRLRGCAPKLAWWCDDEGAHRVDAGARG